MTTKLLAVETAQPDSSKVQWYRLGLTPKAAQQFMLRIGFWDKWSDTTKGRYRRSQEDAWIGEQFGTSLVSYDAANAIRKWLRDVQTERACCDPVCAAAGLAAAACQCRSSAWPDIQSYSNAASVAWLAGTPPVAA